MHILVHGFMLEQSRANHKASIHLVYNLPVATEQHWPNENLNTSLHNTQNTLHNKTKDMQNPVKLTLLIKNISIVNNKYSNC